MKFHGIHHAVATVFGIGFLPGAPGTWGSLAAVAAWVGLQHVIPTTGIILITVFLFFIGVWITDHVARHEADEDPAEIVLDEWVGQWIPLWVIPATPEYIIGALILFRIFDVAKPWPVSLYDNVSGGWGIMLDDIAAGVYALLILKGIMFIL